MDDGAIEPTLTAADPAGSEVPAFGACPASRPEARKPAREQAAHPSYPAISQHPLCATPASLAAASRLPGAQPPPSHPRPLGAQQLRPKDLRLRPGAPRGGDERLHHDGPTPPPRLPLPRPHSTAPRRRTTPTGALAASQAAGAEPAARARRRTW